MKECRNSTSANRELLFAYTFGTQLLLYVFNYKSLRNLAVYLVWIGFALLHLYLYFQLKDKPELLMPRGHAVTGLRNTVLLLLLYQVLRIISVNTQHQELVMPSRGGSTDLFDDRKGTLIDVLLFAVYLAGAVLLNTTLW